MLLVGLTGGLASGKSTVARMLADRGAVVVDADLLARDAVAAGTPGLARVVDAFGDRVLAPDGSLDRAAVAALVFEDPEARRRLEEIVHPEVFRGLAERVEPLRDTDAVVVFDAALLVETGFDQACDLVVVVEASAGERLERVVTQRGMDADDARRRIAAQADARERASRGDVVIANDGTLDDLERAVDALWTTIRERAAR